MIGSNIFPNRKIFRNFSNLISNANISIPAQVSLWKYYHSTDTIDFEYCIIIDAYKVFPLQEGLRLAQGVARGEGHVRRGTSC